MVKICLQNANSLEPAAILASDNLGWKVVQQEKNADILIHSQSTVNALVSSISTIKRTQKVSKIPGSAETSKKHVLASLFVRAQALMTDDLNPISKFWPECYILPNDLEEVSRILTENKSRSKRKQTRTLIYKPSTGSQGEGITLMQDPSALQAIHSTRPKQISIVQKYIPNPLLLQNNIKFDMRIYVLVSSIQPLKIHLCKEGLVRFATSEYSKPTKKNLMNTMAHLTNYSLNKRSKEFEHNDDEDHNPHLESGSKRTLTSLLQTLEKTMEDFDSDRLWEDLKEISYGTMKTMSSNFKTSVLSSEGSHKSNLLDSGCFQIFGLDVLLDSSYGCYLLEVNANPSMRLDHEVNEGGYIPSIVDEYIKGKVMTEALKIIAGETSNDYIEVDVASSYDCLEVMDLVIQEYERVFGGKGGEEYKNRLTNSIFRKLVRTYSENVDANYKKIEGHRIDLAYQRWNMDRARKKGDEYYVFSDLWDFFDALLVIGREILDVGAGNSDCDLIEMLIS
ncbi:hypothetical protein TrLO_g6936 [Triparma laevis f. longispina]|uniref:Uncharacterized protein n=1 Tax=Triparma laevis f. longispina TaxID=1714387 RepID=A0A9W7EBH2_9STRA|nr:hypothetical protein TrLO_g6936 [Triparma laevis f. longispina]